MFDKVKFKKAVDSSGLKGTFIARQIGMNYNVYLQKSNGKNQWKVDEVMSLSRLLRLRNNERDAIFFAREVSNPLTSEEAENVTA